MGQGFWSKNKNLIIISAILWVVIVLIFVAPVSYTIGESNKTGSFDMQYFLEGFFSNIAQFYKFQIFGSPYMGTFGSGVLLFSFFFLIFVGVGIFKGRSKGEYDKIEHGSSDWSQGGEQYKILSKDKGLLLAEKHYLPLDKRGNINVLVVGRIW